MTANDNWQLPKKGDLLYCKNWRSITSLTVTSKIFGRILLQRLKASIDNRLKKEQAGSVRSGRATSEQIFILRKIVEQSLEWEAPLYLNFVDWDEPLTVCIGEVYRT